ncbi:MAG: hypothetical protein CSA11_09250 [Chloroflexi bacterium]|nr:MAG: hypothetical protein CSA11_09250 [Chloroflexota bacterium]
MRHLSEGYAPIFVLSLFISRLLSEGLALYTAVSISWIVILAIIAVITTLCIWNLRPFSAKELWPLWLLAAYVLYPQLDWTAAWTVTAVVIIIFLLSYQVQWAWVQARWFKTAVFVTSALACLTLYTVTLAPDLLPADNGEYQLVAATLGVNHPPGFPFYTLLGHLFTKLPFGATPAYRVNWLSAVTSTATLLIVMAAVYRLTKSWSGTAAATLTLAFATTYWAQATTANIRSLTALFVALAIFALISFRRATQSNNRKRADRFLNVFALAIGFGVAHHLSLAFMALVFGLFVVLIDPSLLKTPRRWLKPILAGGLGFLPLLYLPLRANANVPGATPDLATVNGFIHHALGLGFSGDFFHYTEPTLLWQRLRIMGNVMQFQFDSSFLGLTQEGLLLGMIFSLLLMLWRDRLLALLLGGSFAIHLFITATYRAPQTVEYMLPAYVPAVIGLGYGVGFLVSYSMKQRWLTAVSYSLAAMLLVTAIRQSSRHYPSYDYLSDFTVRHTVAPMLNDAPPHSIILADWHWVTPLWYLQEVENQRPDVTVEFVYPRTADYGVDWATRIQEELDNGRAVISTHYQENAYASLPPAEPYGDAYLFRQEPRTTLPDSFTPLSLVLGDTLEILGYKVGKTAVEITEETTLTLAWQPLLRQEQDSAPQTPISLFTHLIGYDNQTYAQQDLVVTPQTQGITLTQLRLTPRPGTRPGDYAITIGAYNSQPLLSEQGESRTMIATLPVKAMRWAPHTQNPVSMPLADKTRTLIGYDWNHSPPPAHILYLHWQTDEGHVTEVDPLLQESTVPPVIKAWGLREKTWTPPNHTAQFYVPLGQGVVWTGETLSSTASPLLLPQYLAASRPITKDLVISTRLIGYEDDGYHWAWTEQNDSIPAMGALPTLKWIAGSEIRSPHFLTVNENAHPGQTIGATLRLYDAFTNRPVPILDERITQETPWIPLGKQTLPAN